MIAETARLEGERSAEQPSVLIVDRAGATLEGLARRLARQGYAVETAAHAGDAQMILSEDRPDLMLLGVSGPADLDVLRGLHTVNPAIPVILLTDDYDPALRLATRGLGVLGALPRSMALLDAHALNALEPGLRVIDSGARVGRSTVDLAAVDARGSLALVAVALTADARTLLQTLELQGWCREHVDVVRRLFPAAHVAPDRPPRILVVARRFTRFFRQGMEALCLPDVECLTLRPREAATG